MKELPNRNKVPYIYAGLFLLLILSILVGNALLLINRTSSNLVEIYWKQGELVVDSIAVSAQQSIDSIQITEQQVRRNLKKVANQIDYLDEITNGITQEDLKEILKIHHLHSIHIHDQDHLIVSYPESATNSLHLLEKGEPTASILYPKVDFSSQNNLISTEPQDRMFFSPLEYKSLRFPRKDKNGYIDITIGTRKLRQIKVIVGLQIFIASLENRNITKYISFLDDQLRVIADSDPSRIGNLEEKQEYQDALTAEVSYFFLDDDVMDIIQPISFTGDIKGIFKIGFPTMEINRIYQNTVDNSIVFSSWFMLITIITVAIILKWQLSSNAKINSMRKQIQENEKLISLSNLAAGVAHEIRNPLNSISITIQRLQWEFTPKEAEDEEEYITLTKLMKNEVDRLNKIVTDFLGFSKPFEPKKTWFNIQNFMEDLLTLFGAEATSRGIEIRPVYKNVDREYYGDLEKLTQVFLNLLRNALEVSPEHETITVVSEMHKNETWIFQVKDNGIKVSRKTLDQAFDIYFTTKQNGTGLGLYVSRKIIKAHEGTIELASNNSKGVTATVTLPKSQF